MNMLEEHAYFQHHILMVDTFYFQNDVLLNNLKDINLFKDTIRALSEGNDLENQDKFFLENITSLEFRYLASLIKLLKVVIKKLMPNSEVLIALNTN